MKIQFDLFKESGKWGYSGVAEIPDQTNLWDEDVFDLIAKGQGDVTPEAITGRYMHMAVDLIGECASDPNKFFKHLYLRKES